MQNKTESKLRPPKKTVIRVIVFLIIAMNINAQDNKKNQIDSYVEHLMDRQGIPGMALAIISNGKVIHQENFGYANIEHQVPITENSIFRVYSLTKLIISTSVFQLIEQGKLTLNDNISQFVDGLPLSWQTLQIKHLLTHSSGLPDMAALPNRSDLTEIESKDLVFKQPLKFQAGKQYDYNQTNFWLLQQVIEKISKITLTRFALGNQFDADSDSVFFSSDSRDIVRNRVTPYFYFTKGVVSIDHSYMQGDFAYAMNGLNLSMIDYIQWDKNFTQGLFLKKETQQQMLESFNYSDSDKDFAYGWKRFNTNGITSYGFTGSLVTAYRNFPDKNLSIILLSNGLSYGYNIDNIVNYIAGIVDPTLLDINNTIYEKLLQTSLKQPLNEFNRLYLQLNKHYSSDKINFEEQVNYVGYMLLNIKKIYKAIEIFQFNVSSYPDSWNVYDSLGEAYEKSNNPKLALINYRKALELNTENQYQRNIKLYEKIIKLNNLKK
jgi:CubicO group peptidase (beta-lactamase class C family)